MQDFPFEDGALQEVNKDTSVDLRMDLSVSMQRVERDIDNVVLDIKRVEEKIAVAEKNIMEDKVLGQQYWIDKESQLRDEESQLRDKEKQLRDEKIELLKLISKSTSCKSYE